MNNIYQLLKEYGLDDKEIKIYLYLVGNIELTAYKIAKENKIHRSTTYDILERLIRKGFVSKTERHGKAYYSANEITAILSSLKDKETILLNMNKELKKVEQQKELKVRVLEDIEGQKQFNFNLYILARDKKLREVYIIGNTEASSLSSRLFIGRLLKEAKKFKNIKYKGIWDVKFKNSELIKKFQGFGQNKFLDLPSKTATIIFDNSVAFLFTTNQPYVVEIYNELIAQEMKTYFLHLWGISKN